MQQFQVIVQRVIFNTRLSTLYLDFQNLDRISHNLDQKLENALKIGIGCQ